MRVALPFHVARIESVSLRFLGRTNSMGSSS
jgi:hypothetical protein